VSAAVPGPPVDPAEVIGVTLVLRRRAPVPAQLIQGPDFVNQSVLGAAYGADSTDVELVRSVLVGTGLAVDSVDEPSRRMQVSGPAAAVAAAFGTTLTRTASPDPVTGAAVEHRHRTGELSVPAELGGIVEAVLGLDDRPQARAHFRVAAAGPLSTSTNTSFTPLQLGQAYAFPAGTDGAGQSLAIIELGGGYGQQDLDGYFAGLGLATARPTGRSTSISPLPARTPWPVAAPACS